MWLRLIALISALLLPSLAWAEERIVVFAAASLQTSLDRVVEGWEAGGGAKVVISYAGTSALARQIEAGAPADLFFAASSDWMDRIEAEGLIRPDTRQDLLGNALVLIRTGPGDDTGTIGPGFDLLGRLGDGRLAMALVDAVPAGIYGREALASLGLWDGVADHVAQTDNVRAALALVASGEAPIGVVYRTDALADARVSVVGTFPEDSHAPILYPVALTVESTHPEAGAFLAYLASSAARAVFEADGFTRRGAP